MPIFEVTDPKTGRTVELTSQDDTPPTEQELENVFSSLSNDNSGFSEAKINTSTNDPRENKQIEEQGILGKLFNVPGATSRAAIQSNPALALGGPLAGLLALSGIGGKEAQQAAGQGALNPSSVPTFQNQAIAAGQSMGGESQSVYNNFVKGAVPSAVGLAADIATNPADMIGSLLGKTPGSQQAGKVIDTGVKKIFRFENSLQQAQKAKEGLDNLRSTLGTGVRLAIKDVENVPTNLKIGDIPEKVFSNMQKKVYDIQFTSNKNGNSIVNNVGNLNKLKEATYDLLTSRDFIEASNAEKAQIRRFAGMVSNEMRTAAKKAGKPIDSALNSYSNFMKRYEIINPKLVDKYGNAQGNKLKEIFKITSERATKEAWKDVAKASPEVKSVMGSMKRRELLKNLVAASVAGAAVKGGTDLVTGH